MITGVLSLQLRLASGVEQHRSDDPGRFLLGGWVQFGAGLVPGRVPGVRVGGPAPFQVRAEHPVLLPAGPGGTAQAMPCPAISGAITMRR